MANKHKILAMVLVELETAEQTSKLLKDTTIKFGWCKPEIQEYKPQVVQKPLIKCAKCQKYGHKVANCPFKEKCAICCKSHNSKKCPNKRKKKAWKCANCGGKH